MTRPRAIVVLLSSLLSLVLLATPRAQQAQAPPSSLDARPSSLVVRITSPLGRTGATGAVRIVAQVAAPGKDEVVAVRFFVDGVRLGEARKGPPWGIDWTDDNPLDKREIRVDAVDSAGHLGSDSVTLTPLEIVDHAEVSSVLVETSVQDKSGRFVTGMGPEGFQVNEDGVPQKLDLVRSEQLPATFTLLIDSSSSMSQRIDFVRDAAANLTGYLRPNDRIIVAPFSRHLETITGPTDDRQTVSDAIAAIEPGGGTAILNALSDTAKLVSGVSGRHAIILLTDGYDEHSTERFTDALADVQRSGASVYVVGIGGVAGISLKGEKLLRQIATDTGGRAFFPSREIELRPIHEMVASEVTLRYVLTYTPTNQKVDGTWRKIAVKTLDPELKVRARPGYFAPKPPPVRPTIEFTLTDTNPVPHDMTIEELQVVEDGVTQKLEAFQEASTPVSIVFALDASGSMKKATEPLKAAARSFVGQVRPEDSLATLLFSDTVRFEHDLTTRRDWAIDAINHYIPRGGTALYDAVYDALSRLKGIEGRRMVIVMTDGRDENNPGTAPGSTHTFAQVLDRLKEVDAVVFSVGLGPKIDRPVLEQLAAMSGGEAYFPQDVTVLGGDFNRILETLRRRYVISYTSTNSARDGAWRKVEIQSARAGVSVASRGGYFAPAK
jgi:Ca-activated chloride channel homolog